ncbi:hypothetical protein HK098_003801 [Nowakowskiella sp. JEL0407]|nr:hypothetical protein HK098_003801 [Nowakowskiella sp. JEL0407]
MILGVRIFENEATTLPCDFVVDATGRAAKSAKCLEWIDINVPRKSYEPFVQYTSAIYELSPEERVSKSCHPNESELSKLEKLFCSLGIVKRISNFSSFNPKVYFNQFDKCANVIPRNLCVVGDALAAFNPVFA